MLANLTNGTRVRVARYDVVEGKPKATKLTGTMKRIPVVAATHKRGAVSRNRFTSKTRFSMSVDIHEYDEGDTMVRRFRVRPEATMPAVLRERSRRRAAIRAVRLRGGTRTREHLMEPVKAGSVTLTPASSGLVELTPRG